MLPCELLKEGAQILRGQKAKYYLQSYKAGGGGSLLQLSSALECS